VTADGDPWHGDEYDVLPGEPADSAADPTTDSEPATTPDTTTATGPPARTRQPPRPRGNASRADWAAYAVELGVASKADAATMIRDELMELCTPPELKPPVPCD
jgi:hypothetical protein